MSTRTFHYRWRWSLQSDAASLWPYVSDTERFNAVTGFPAATYTEEPLPEGGSRRLAHLRQYGALIAWYDAPFEWVREREFVSVREYTVGPLRATRTRLCLEPRPDGGTALIYEVWATPGNLLGYPGIPIQIGLLMGHQFQRAFRQIDAYVQARAAQPFATPRHPIGGTGDARLRAFSRQLVAVGHDPLLVDRLLAHVRAASDDQLTRMRPYALADSWHTNRRATLELFLHASRLGLLDLSWDLICPDCRGAKQQVPSLRDVTSHAHCPSCNIDYAVDFAYSVEATFQVNAAIKAVSHSTHCIGGPQNTPHILAQQVLAPGETRTLTLPLAAWAYRWRAPRLAGADPTPRTGALRDDPASGRILLEARPDAEPPACTVTVDAHGLAVLPAHVSPGPITFTLHNASDREHILLLEQPEWSDQASTAAMVTSLQAFRDLFSSEALRPGESISVENLTILFTDLQGSTSLYRAIGDAPAFGRVMTHFDLLRENVAAHQGALVKTIGDAIMAVFADPADAVAAGLAILESFRVYNMAHPAGPLVLKLGIHQGPCIAVTLNDRLDYFGSVVNIAARLEGQSLGDEVVISEAVAGDPGVRRVLTDSAVAVEPFHAYLRGFTESFALCRLRLAPLVVPQSAAQPVFLAV